MAVDDGEIQRLRDRLAADPRSLAFVPLAQLLRRAGRVAEAWEVVREGLRVHPEHPPARVVLAQLHLDAGQPRLAHVLLEEVVAVDPENVAARSMLVALLVEEGRTREAEALLGAAGEPLSVPVAHPMPRTGDPFDHGSVAEGLARRGRLDRARAVWLRLLAVDPAHPGVTASLAALDAEITAHGSDVGVARRHRLPGRVGAEAALREEACELPLPAGPPSPLRRYARRFWRDA